MVALRFKPCIRRYNPEIIPQILLTLLQMLLLVGFSTNAFVGWIWFDITLKCCIYEHELSSLFQQT